MPLLGQSFTADVKAGQTPGPPERLLLVVCTNVTVKFASFQWGLPSSQDKRRKQEDKLGTFSRGGSFPARQVGDKVHFWFIHPCGFLQSLGDLGETGFALNPIDKRGNWDSERITRPTR